MNIFRKKPNKETYSLKLGQKGKKAFAVYAAIWAGIDVGVI